VIAVELFKNNEASLRKAAEIAGTDRESFKEILEERGVTREVNARPGMDERIEEAQQ